MSGLFARLAALFARPASMRPLERESVKNGGNPPLSPLNPLERESPPPPDAATFIAGFEGFRAKPYLPTPNDVPTIGHGTTRYPDGRAVTLADPPCSEARARAWLAHDIAGAEAAVDLYVKAPITKAQRVALTSFAFNCGVSAFAGSTLLRLLNGRRYGDARREFARWNKQAGIELAGLTKRREAEAALFGGHP